MPDFFFNLSNYEFPSMGLTRNPSNIFKQTHLLRHGDFWSLSVHEFFLTWIWLWVLSQASKLVPWLLGLHLCSQPRGLATTRGAALLCCGGIFDEAPLSSSKIWDEERSSFYFLCDFYVIVMISHVMFAILGPDMPCILRRTTTWNPLPLTIFDSVCGGCWF